MIIDQMKLSKDPNQVNIESFISNENFRTGYYLRKCIPSTIEDRLNVTYFFLDKTTMDLTAFISLSAHRLVLKKSDEVLLESLSSDKDRAQIPTIKIDQLAVSQPYQRMNLATEILEYIINIILTKIGTVLGVRLIMAQIFDNPTNNSLFDKLQFRELPREWFSSKDPFRPSLVRKFTNYESGVIERKPVKSVYFDLKWDKPINL